MPHPVTAYAESVLAGDLVAGRLVKLACERHLRDLETGHKRKLRFDAKSADDALYITELCHHKKGRWAKPACTCAEDWRKCERRIRWEPWQRFIIGSIFGWKQEREIGWLRRYLEAWIGLARKNGKSFIGNACAFYMAKFDNEPEAECYVAATKQEQSRYVHNIGKGMLSVSPALRGSFLGWNQKLANIYTADGDKYEPLSAESRTQDGLNPHFILLDECHAHPDSDLRNVLASGTGARDQALEMCISTAGIAWEGGFWKERRDEAEAMLSGQIPEDDNVFAYFAEPDEGLDWKTSDLYLEQANPNLGVSVLLSDLHKKRRQAVRNPIQENEFRTKQGNEWTQQTIRLIQMDDWHNCPSELDLEALRGRRCYGGVDLGKSQALSAYMLVFPPDRPDGEWSVLGWYWITQGLIERNERKNRAYIEWARQGLIEVCPGKVRDDDMVRARILATREIYDVAEVGFDPFNAPDLMRRLDIEGVTVVSVAQTFKHLSPPTKKLLDLITLGQLNHGGDPVLGLHARNVGGQEDGKGNIQPSRKNSAGWYDGIQATIIAINRALAGVGQQRTITGDVHFA